jgi:hypothetical protein
VERIPRKPCGCQGRGHAREGKDEDDIEKYREPVEGRATLGHRPVQSMRKARAREPRTIQPSVFPMDLRKPGRSL